ncbi:MAG TPA: nucleotidyl transferase AbiEii/AbiGii toxin family protein [Myxococcales bacterium]|nr:nucleotidyl transferase AbiEii/AbiGii toxin family protein [Myxococcales bacterium]
MKRRTYATDEAFRIALEERVKAAAKAQGHLDATRQRQLLLADRYLARIAMELGDSVVAKGGIALELRLPQARATQDLDVHVSGSTDHLIDRLQAAGRIDLADRLRFDISTEANDLRTMTSLRAWIFSSSPAFRAPGTTCTRASFTSQRSCTRTPCPDQPPMVV